MTRRHLSHTLQPVRLGPTRRWLLYLLVAVLLLTGVVWLVVHPRAGDDALPSPLEPWMMKVHGGAAMLAIYFAGTMLHGHMLNAWRRHRNRSSGGAAAAVLLLLAVSGYGLYYFNGDALRAATEWVHWVVGFAAPVALCVHVLNAPVHPTTGRARKAARSFLRAMRRVPRRSVGGPDDR
jgi:hypothetical protein